jgi:hypothetical protein
MCQGCACLDRRLDRGDAAWCGCRVAFAVGISERPGIACRFVLLKEQNALYTERYHAKRLAKAFEKPRRLTMVRSSSRDDANCELGELRTRGRNRERQSEERKSEGVERTPAAAWG